mgnify:CR=1 FL=1
MKSDTAGENDDELEELDDLDEGIGEVDPGVLQVESTLVNFSSFASTRAKRLSAVSVSFSSAIAADLFKHKEGVEDEAEEEEADEAEEVDEEEGAVSRITASSILVKRSSVAVGNSAASAERLREWPS